MGIKGQRSLKSKKAIPQAKEDLTLSALARMTVSYGSGHAPLGSLATIFSGGGSVKITPKTAGKIKAVSLSIRKNWPSAVVKEFESFLLLPGVLGESNYTGWRVYRESPATKRGAGVEQSSANADDSDEQRVSAPRSVAVVGVEGSGKTVLLAALGDQYESPNKSGYFLSPKNFATASYVHRQVARLKEGEWPSATNEDALIGLDWEVRQRIPGNRPKVLMMLSFLDFAGEVYREAFIQGRTGSGQKDDPVSKLRDFIAQADDIVVLVNLRDVITNGPADLRAEETSWVTKAILDFAIPPEGSERQVRAAIVLSQADTYRATIKKCGGAQEALRKYLPHVAYNYDWLDVFEVSSVDDTKLDADGNIVPSGNFSSLGVEPLFNWMLRRK